MSKVAAVKGRTPSFADADLTVPTPVHLQRCPARLDEEGRASPSMCRCSSATWFLTPGEDVEIVREEGRAVLVRPDSRGLVWVEETLLSFRRDREEGESTSRSEETDLLVLWRFLDANPRKRWPRRRARPQGGDLVFIRSEFRAGERSPMRFLFIERRDGKRYAVLLDAGLSPSQGFRPAWQHWRRLELAAEPWQQLLVAFPLPDKTQSPGWKEVQRGMLRRTS